MHQLRSLWSIIIERLKASSGPPLWQTLWMMEWNQLVMGWGETHLPCCRDNATSVNIPSTTMPEPWWSASYERRSIRLDFLFIRYSVAQPQSRHAKRARFVQWHRDLALCRLVLAVSRRQHLALIKYTFHIFESAYSSLADKSDFTPSPLRSTLISHHRQSAWHVCAVYALSQLPEIGHKL